MSFLKVNHKEAEGNNNREFTPIAEGDYEAIISEAKIGKSQSGNDMITITLTIRDDVNQQFAKRKIWDYLVYTEKAKFKLQQVAKALKIPDGTNIETIQDFAKAILYSSIRIAIKNREEEYNGQKKTRDYVAAYKEAQTTARSTAQTDPFAISDKSISNSDLPI
jgi:hypothetical protein